MIEYRLEMNTGQDTRVVKADYFQFLDLWIVFYRRPPQGGSREYWRVKIEHVVSMETKA